MNSVLIEAGLGVTEIALVYSYIDNPDVPGSPWFSDSTAYEKLLDYFCDEMPIDVAKCRTLEPDIWILEKLESIRDNNDVSTCTTQQGMV
tara:strand:- start:507 stop:776 length:270 start_codon:yes stop_codon:yes gene_type:complete